MTTTYTPTSNWSDRTLKGRDLSGRDRASRPNEPIVFEEPEASALASLGASRGAAELNTPVFEPVSQGAGGQGASGLGADFVPAFARKAPKSRSRGVLMAAPVLIAALALGGYMLANGGERAEETGVRAAEAPALSVTAVEPASADESLADESLVGMEVTDATPLTPIPTEAAAPPRPAAARPATRTRTVERAATEARTPPPAAPEPIIAAEPIAPAVSEPSASAATSTEPLIVTEPIT